MKTANQPLRILFWPMGGHTVASSRYRLYSLLPHLEASGIRPTLLPGGKTKLGVALQGLLLARRADGVFLQKKLPNSTYLKALRAASRRLLYDLDDAYYTLPTLPSPELERVAKLWHSRLDAVLHVADAVITGNDELAAYASRFCKLVHVIPTSVFIPDMPVKKHGEVNPVTVGWIGGRNTLIYLPLLLQVFETLAVLYGPRFLLKIVADAEWTAPGLEANLVNRPWTLESEVAEMLSFDIGIMPLVDDEWSRGKCGFKALQSMAYGLPVVVSPVGVNRVIVQDGINGYLASTPDEWVQALSRLMDSCDLRARLGTHGRALVAGDYSVASAAERLGHVLFTVCQRD